METSKKALALTGMLPGLLALWIASAATLEAPANADAPTFYKDAVPVIEEHCQVCHRTGGIAPMAFQNYAETRPYAWAIADAVRTKRGCWRLGPRRERLRGILPMLPGRKNGWTGGRFPRLRPKLRYPSR